MSETPTIDSRYGCLTVMDSGENYPLMIEARKEAVINERIAFEDLISTGELQRKDWHGWDGEKTTTYSAYAYTPITFETLYDYIGLREFDKEIAKLEQEKSVVHYMCKCRKCGKIRYYTLKTLLEEPDYCYRPIHCSSKSGQSNSNRAKNSTYNKQQKYQDNEAVILVLEKDQVIPADEYCGKWNEKREAELKKQAEKDAAIIATIPRIFAKNYDIDYSGLTYETLEIKECVNDHLESVPFPFYDQMHRKHYRDITVYKQYRCKCHLCGKEQLITCDKFGIYPPTAYGYRAYNGYWSEAYCDCHPISSFQWIVNKLLLDNGVKYSAEYSLPDLFGYWKHNLLRFDFAVFNPDDSLKCLIECQGEQHYKSVHEFGGKKQFEMQLENDELKRKYAADNGIKLIEISYKDKKYETVEQILRQNNII